MIVPPANAATSRVHWAVPRSSQAPLQLPPLLVEEYEPGMSRCLPDAPHTKDGPG